MADISTINMLGDTQDTAIDIFNEHVSGIIFDISKRQDVFAGYSKASSLFLNKVTPVNVSSNLIVDYGIDENLMSGVPYYHLSKYQDILSAKGKQQPIYVMFADLSDMSAIHTMQKLAKRQLFQIGIWTEQLLIDGAGKTTLLDNLKEALLSYTRPKESMDRVENSTPFNVILSCNYAYRESNKVSYMTLPDILHDKHYDIPSLTVLLSQESSDKIHEMQSTTVSNTPVGCLGIMLGILSSCDAEYSVADHSLYNLEDYVSQIELGMGDIANAKYTPVNLEKGEDIIRSQLAKKGYVFMVDTEGLKGNYFSNDQTLGQGDYNSLTRCRVCNKVHRIIYRQMLKYVNSGFHIIGSGKANDLNILKNDIALAIQNRMGTSSGTSGYTQISGLSINADYDESILNTKNLAVEVVVVQVKDSKSMNVSASVNVNQ